MAGARWRAAVIMLTHGSWSAVIYIHKELLWQDRSVRCEPWFVWKLFTSDKILLFCLHITFWQKMIYIL